MKLITFTLKMFGKKSLKNLIYKTAY